jgi:hypothetical protein
MPQYKTVTSASSNITLPDDGDGTETCWSCFNVNFNVNFKIVFKTIHLCISWWITNLVSKCRYIYLCMFVLNHYVCVCVCVCYNRVKYSFCQFFSKSHFTLFSSGAASPLWMFRTTSYLQRLRYCKISRISETLVNTYLLANKRQYLSVQIPIKGHKRHTDYFFYYEIWYWSGYNRPSVIRAGQVYGRSVR